MSKSPFWKKKQSYNIENGRILAEMSIIAHDKQLCQ